MNTTQSFECVYCKGKKSRPLYPLSDIFGNSYTLLECQSCEARVLHPPPTVEDILGDPYDDTYYGEGEKKFKGIIEQILDYFRNSRARLLNKYLGGKGKVLDIGCGNGGFLHSLNQLGDYEIHGLEMPGGSAERAAKVPGIHLKIGAIDWEDYPAKSFDAITLFHVFEHLMEPVKTLEIIDHLMKDDGTLIMAFPNIDSFQSRWFKGNWFHLDPPRHLFFFTPKAFKREMKKYGFEVVKEKHFNVEYNPFGIQQSLLNRFTSQRDVLYEHLKGNKQYTKKVSKSNLIVQDLFFKLTYPLFTGLDIGNMVWKKGATIEFVLKRTKDRA